MIVPDRREIEGMIADCLQILFQTGLMRYEARILLSIMFLVATNSVVLRTLLHSPHNLQVVS
jgi:hypothetical protein